ncbi:MAG: HAMP domain-containing sensor histidine kinase [Pseudomonadota bacterium]
MFRSSVYRLTLLASVAFFLVALFIGGGLTVYNLSAIERNDEAELLDTYEWLREMIEEDGLQGLREEWQDEPWMTDPEEGLFLLAEEGFAFLVVGASGDALMGLPDLAGAPPGESWQTFVLEEHEDEEEIIEARLLREPIGDDLELIVARSRSWAYFDVQETLFVSIFFLIVISIPLALVIGYALSRRVHQRLDDLSGALAQIGHDSLEQRAAVSKRHDEFDALAENVNAMLDRLQALHRNIESVSVGVAHDLKTPLSRLSSRLQLMRQDINQPAALASHLEGAEQQLEGITRTFSSVLRLSEIESGDRRSAFQSLDLSALVADLIDSYQPVFADAGRQLDSAILPDQWLHGDADLLVQMITNLLENSIEHGKPSGRTWVHLQGHPQGLVLQVGDDGPGIPAAQQSRVFERFYRGDASRSAPGNGLGLAIVRSISELHAGDIVLLKGQKGAVFDCYFPASLAP